MNLEQQAHEKYPTVTKTGRDFLAWAKRFVWRDEMGDKGMLPIQVQFAREAMGMGPKKP